MNLMNVQGEPAARTLLNLYGANARHVATSADNNTNARNQYNTTYQQVKTLGKSRATAKAASMSVAASNPPGALNLSNVYYSPVLFRTWFKSTTYGLHFGNKRSNRSKFNDHGLL